jgi:hypothetical protein
MERGLGREMKENSVNRKEEEKCKKRKRGKEEKETGKRMKGWITKGAGPLGKWSSTFTAFLPSIIDFIMVIYTQLILFLFSCFLHDNFIIYFNLTDGHTAPIPVPSNQLLFSPLFFLFIFIMMPHSHEGGGVDTSVTTYHT